jgi:hypothetical protein
MGGMAQFVECLLSELEALSPIPSVSKKKEKKGGREGERKGEGEGRRKEGKKKERKKERRKERRKEGRKEGRKEKSRKERREKGTKQQLIRATNMYITSFDSCNSHMKSILIFPHFNFLPSFLPSLL